MGKEIELTLADIDKEEAVSRLEALGARYSGTETYVRIEAPIILNVKWVRLRSNGKTTTLTYKDRSAVRGLSMDEYEVEVGDFKTAARIFFKLFKGNMLFWETKRMEYHLDGAMITIDKWPKLPWLIEIEGKSEKSVLATLKKLGIKGENLGNVSLLDMYWRQGLDFFDCVERDDDRIAKRLNLIQKQYKPL